MIYKNEAEQKTVEGIAGRIECLGGDKESINLGSFLPCRVLKTSKFKLEM